MCTHINNYTVARDPTQQALRTREGLFEGLFGQGPHVKDYFKDSLDKDPKSIGFTASAPTSV